MKIMNRQYSRDQVIDMAKLNAGLHISLGRGVCSDQKLEMYRDICIENRYYGALATIMQQAINRGLA